MFKYSIKTRVVIIALTLEQIFGTNVRETKNYSREIINLF